MSQFLSTPKFPLPQPPSSVSFRQSQRISASFCSTSDGTISSKSSSLYQVLGLNIGASGQEIKAAYHKLARVLHPDVVTKGNNGSSATAAAATEEFIKVQAAYATLSDPIKRAEYNRTLFMRQRRAGVIRSSPSSSKYSGYTIGTNWETDQCW